MPDTNLPDEDDVLRRMLNTPLKPHKPKNEKVAKQKPVEKSK